MGSRWRRKANGCTSTTWRRWLTGFVEAVKGREFGSFAELRETFPAADQVGKLTVFNIGGNKARLVAAVHYNRKKIYVRAVLSHDE